MLACPACGGIEPLIPFIAAAALAALAWLRTHWQHVARWWHERRAVQ